MTFKVERKRTRRWEGTCRGSSTPVAILRESERGDGLLLYLAPDTGVGHNCRLTVEELRVLHAVLDEALSAFPKEE